MLCKLWRCCRGTQSRNRRIGFEAECAVKVLLRRQSYQVGFFVRDICCRREILGNDMARYSLHEIECKVWRWTRA